MKDAKKLNSLLGVEPGKFDQDTRSVEAYFKIYFDSKEVPYNPQLPITNLFALIQEIERKQPTQPLESTQIDYPDGNVLLTKALIYLIETYGLTKDLLVDGHALAILRDPRILNLAHQNNHQLIYEINRVIKKRKEDEALEKEKIRIRHFLSEQLKNVKILETYTQALSHFLYHVEHPIEEPEMKKALKDLIKETNGNPDMIVLIACMAHGRSDWNLLNTIYHYYREENPSGVEDLFLRLRTTQKSYKSKTDKKSEARSLAIDQLINDLHLVDHVHVFTTQKTENEARWMAAGGFAFGMETVVGMLQFVALATSLNAWNILAISFASCLVAGPFISMYFQSGHFNELKKLNQREYFDEFRPNPSREDTSWGEIVGHIGTFEEGAAAGMLLMTLGGMILLDTFSRAILGGEYDSAMSVVPSYYFITEVLMTCHWGWYFAAAAAIAAIVYSSARTAYVMKRSHFALDVPNCIEYFNDAEEDKQMRGVVNAETREPLFFSDSLRWRHKIGTAVEEFKEDYFPSRKANFAEI